MTARNEATTHRTTTINISIKTLDYDDSKNILIFILPNVLAIVLKIVRVTLKRLVKSDVRGGARAA